MIILNSSASIFARAHTHTLSVKMDLPSLSISASQTGKLKSAGHTSPSSVPPSVLDLDLMVAENEAVQILKVASERNELDEIDNISSAIVDGAQTAWDMLRDEESSKRITTSCSDLDAILGGGIRCKQLTEIGGVPGIGKTQLGIQLAVNVQIPADYGGLGGKAIYIDTEGSFMVERALQIAEACAEDMLEYNSFLRRDSQLNKHAKDFLNNIFYFRPCTYTEQIDVISYLEKFILEHKEVKVVIIDSIAFQFRQEFEDMAVRTRLLSGIALELTKLADNYNLAKLGARTDLLIASSGELVVLLNQVTTRFTEGSAHFTLALGDSWAHASANRIILYWNGNERYAYVDKSPSLPSASAPYAVTGRGIRNSESNIKRVKLM